MNDPLFPLLGRQLRRARTQHGLSQSQLAGRVGRSPARISELERDLAANRLGRDRLTLFGELCAALDLVPVLVPRRRHAELLALTGVPAPAPVDDVRRPGGSVYDDVFVDLTTDEDAD